VRESQETVPFPLVTVVTPTLGRQSLFTRVVPSVRRQHYPHVEHLIVCDPLGPTPEELLRQLTTKCGVADVAMRVVPAGEMADQRASSYRPARAAHARMAGVAAARGELIAFLDDDNEYEADHLGSTARALFEHGGARAVHSWRTLYTSDGEPFLDRRNPWTSEIAQAREDYHALVAAGVCVEGSNQMLDSIHQNTVDSSEWLIRRDVLDAVPWRTTYSPSERAALLGEDVAFCFDLKSKGVRVVCTRRATVRYYLGGFSTSGFKGYEVSARTGTPPEG
jgi:glycosyltransferase involved in cell wall biosynthesis